MDFDDRFDDEHGQPSELSVEVTIDGNTLSVSGDPDLVKKAMNDFFGKL
jgi:hypothetical protein